MFGVRGELPVIGCVICEIVVEFVQHWVVFSSSFFVPFEVVVCTSLLFFVPFDIVVFP